MHSIKGFTLIELAIVMVIIGLIVGGVLTGRDLIRTAGLRKDISEFHQLDTAVNTFRLKYNCLPGDCINAASYLTGATNGNGDGWITASGQYYDIFCGSVGYGESESASASDALARASMIKMAPLTNLISANHVSGWVAGVDLLPVPSRPDLGVIISIACTGVLNDTPVGNHYVVGVRTASDGSGTVETSSPAYTTADALYIDAKMDDGKPLTGSVVSANVATFDDGPFRMSSYLAASGTCVSNATDNPYNLNEKVPLCALLVKPGF